MGACAVIPSQTFIHSKGGGCTMVKSRGDGRMVIAVCCIIVVMKGDGKVGASDAQET